MEQVILVDENDTQVGLMEKQEAHVQGRLHRAVSVFIFNSAGKMLLQQRADTKYHSPSLWSNTCCSHPRPGETAHAAAQRRLVEEMGMKVRLRKSFNFVYRAEFGNGLVEYEFDHVFVGVSDKLPKPNPEEVGDYKYMNVEYLQEHIGESPSTYTPWLKICMDKWIETLTNSANDEGI